MTRKEKIESIEEFIHDTKREMVIAQEFGDMFAFTKLKASLREAQRQLKELAWIEGAEEFHAGIA